MTENKSSSKYGDIRNREMVNPQSIEPLLLITVEDTTEAENKCFYWKKPKIQLKEVDKH